MHTFACICMFKEREDPDALFQTDEVDKSKTKWAVKMSAAVWSARRHDAAQEVKARGRAP